MGLRFRVVIHECHMSNVILGNHFYLGILGSSYCVWTLKAKETCIFATSCRSNCICHLYELIKVTCFALSLNSQR